MNVKIPYKYQIFASAVVIDSKDAERLGVYLSGFMHLASILPQVNEPDLRRLVVLELMGKQRKKLLDRLLMRLCRLDRLALQKQVNKLIGHHEVPHT